MQTARNPYHRLEALAAMLIVAATAALLAPVVSAQSDRNRVCAENVNALAFAVLQYAEDYDRTLPQAVIWNDPARFRVQLGPYVGSTRPFRCPATGVGYATNPALAGRVLSGLGATDTTEMLRDERAHPDRKTTVAFLDGHVERGGVEEYFPDADAECYRRVRRIAFAVRQYAGDYDDRTPFQTDDEAFRAVVQPYLGSSRYWNCPDTKLPYSLAQEFRGRSLDDFADFDGVEIVRDPNAHRSGVATVCYLDGYAEQVGPRGIKYPTAIAESQRRVSGLGIALLQYSQDYNERLPPITTTAALKPLLLPYTRTSRTFEPPRGGTPFQLNGAVGGTNLFDYPSPSEVIWIRDPNGYGDGLITAGFLDGHIERRAP